MVGALSVLSKSLDLILRLAEGHSFIHSAEGVQDLEGEVGMEAPEPGKKADPGKRQVCLQLGRR